MAFICPFWHFHFGCKSLGKDRNTAAEIHKPFVFSTGKRFLKGWLKYSKDVSSIHPNNPQITVEQQHQVRNLLKTSIYSLQGIFCPSLLLILFLWHQILHNMTFQMYGTVTMMYEETFTEPGTRSEINTEKQITCLAWLPFLSLQGKYSV